jgi:hypothetical protein
MRDPTTAVTWPKFGGFCVEILQKFAIEVESQNAFWQDIGHVIHGTPGILESMGIPYALHRKLHSGWWKPFQVLSL